jgi:hypothetical protein
MGCCVNATMDDVRDRQPLAARAKEQITELAQDEAEVSTLDLRLDRENVSTAELIW